MIKGIITGGGLRNGEPANDAGFLKRAEGVNLGTFHTSITDSGTGTPSDTIAAGVGVTQIAFPVGDLGNAAGAGFGATTAGDIVTGYTPGYRFKLLSFDFVTDLVGAGAGASAPCNLEIGTTNVTGGVCTVTLASTDTIGKVTAGTAITALNTGSATDTISLEKATSVVFTAGAGYFLVTIQNMDTADAFATLAQNSSLTADETNARVLKVEETVDNIGHVVWTVPRDYDEETDVTVVRVLASQLTSSTDNDVELDSEIYVKTAGTALPADLNITAPGTVLSTTEQWIEFELEGQGLDRDDVVYFELITNGANDTDGEEVLIHDVEVVYRSCLVSYDEFTGDGDTGTNLR
jgi:hypothetical protein